ncbi:MAG: hypothetical protein WDN03_17755 [Rhizomicrobium sp.]
MNIVKKAALGLAMLAGAAVATAAPAAAHVSVGIGFGGYGPGYYGGYGPGPVCDPYSRWYDPYRCDDYDDDGYYNGPVFIDGIWLNGGFRSRYYGGHRQFYYHGGWHGGSGFHGGGFGGHGGGHGGFGGGHGGGFGGHGGGGHHH